MRSSVLLAAPFVAAAYGAKTTNFATEGTTLVSVLSGSKTVVSTYTYSNPATSYLTETNSLGVVTGMPSLTGTAADTSLVTNQPEVATIPAGEPTGINTIYLNVSATLTSFEISVGKSTTVVLGGGAVATDASLTTGSSAGVATGAGHHGHKTGGGNGGSSASASASASSSGTQTGSGSQSTNSNAAAPVKIASVGVLGLGAFIAALL